MFGTDKKALPGNGIVAVGKEEFPVKDVITCFLPVFM